MSNYEALAKRMEDGEVILLDGAIGTQLQSMGVPMDSRAWAGTALRDHPFTVRRMHENYIEAGVDVITANTYPTARHNLEPIGLADLTTELNLRAVMLAQDARDKAAKERPVYIAGSVSNYGLMTGAEPGWRDYAYFAHRAEHSERQVIANLREQAEILAEAGVDFLVAEPTGSSIQRRWVIEACVSTGLPVWMGFKCRLDAADGALKVGYRSEEPFLQEFDTLCALGGGVATVFHSSVAATDAAVPLVRENWSGPIAVYPEADRHDYVATFRDEAQPTPITPEEFVAKAKSWVDGGVQIVGGCCGIEIEYIRPLREALPTHVPG
jgi:S-methylmethionine-dependent homocysteine/selenocysteine methylase